jgi:uncharacterized repeat protein (TIGR01451 family)
MKRIMLRVAALVTVVVLGLIAIAQAQRSNSEAADPSAEPSLAAESAEASNPLRSAAPATPLDLPSATQASQSPLRSREPAGTEPAELSESLPADPFRRAPADPGVATALATENPIRPEGALASHYEQVEQQPAGVELADAGGSPLRPYPSSEGNRYPALQPAEQEEGAPSVAVGPRLQPPNATDPPAATVMDLPLRQDAPAQMPAGENLRLSGLTAGPTTDAAADMRSVAAPETVGQGMLDEGAGQPGAQHLEGAQTPQVTIEKTAPAGMQVGKSATFVVKVRNTGAVAAASVEVRDQVPKGTQLTSTTPRASRGTRNELIWSLGTLEPGQETTVEMEVMPIEEGEIGSVATVHFSAAATARAVATKPELVLDSSAASQVLIGETLKLSITLSNPGSGVATGVVLSERVPAGLRHVAGTDLEYEVGTLQPGESRKLELDLVADRPGAITNMIFARGEGNLRAEHQLNINVVAPELEVAVDGPQRRFLEREATYEVGISNPGTAAAKDIELVAHLPDGLEFVSANNAGHYDQATRAVHWRLDELPVQETGVVKLVTMPIRAGEHSLRIRGTAAKGVETESEQPVIIEGIAAILFEVRDVVDPIEVSGETVYEISVLNQGSKAATNVRVHMLLPPEMQAVAAEGPTNHAMEARQVAFEPLARLAPKADTVYRVRVRGVQPGDLRVRVQVLTDEMSDVPVTKEESTRVYSDQ